MINSKTDFGPEPDIMIKLKNQFSPKTRMFTTFIFIMTGPLITNNVACYLICLDIVGWTGTFLYLRPMIDMD